MERAWGPLVCRIRLFTCWDCWHTDILALSISLLYRVYLTVVQRIWLFLDQCWTMVWGSWVVFERLWMRSYDIALNRIASCQWLSLIYFASPSVRDPNLKQKSKDLLECFTAIHFQQLFNILLCLHIFSVHITHQNKNKNYENLDQLSYDNKRGPKVYLHGQCTPPTNSLNVATIN
jgi:hypothetical protein